MSTENKTLELLDPKTAGLIRNVYQQSGVALNSAIEGGLGEPWLTHFRKLKSDYDSALKELGPTDQAPAAMNASRHLESFYSLLSCANSLSDISRMKLQGTSALNSAVDAEITKRIGAGELVSKADLDKKISDAIEQRTKSGELFTKDVHTSLCSAAKDTGIQQGLDKAKTDFEAKETAARTLETRKTQLATNGLPIPTANLDKILGGTDAEFNAAMETAKTRITELREKKGLALNSNHDSWKMVWSEEGFNALSALADMGGGERHEPLAGGGNRAGRGESRVVMVV
jgi:hypothetical protein